jgi:hypothetical protein
MDAIAQILKDYFKRLIEMTKKNISAYLNSLSKQELVRHIMNIVELESIVKDYFNVVIEPLNEEEILLKYKKEIKKLLKLNKDIVDIRYN